MDQPVYRFTRPIVLSCSLPHFIFLYFSNELVIDITYRIGKLGVDDLDGTGVPFIEEGIQNVLEVAGVNLDLRE
jgi:hypothetical protein